MNDCAMVRYRAITGRADMARIVSTFGQSVEYCPCSRVTASSTVLEDSFVMKISGNHRSFQIGTRL